MAVAPDASPCRVLLVHETLTPYRLPMFQALARAPGYSFDFVFHSVDPFLLPHASPDGFGLRASVVGGGVPGFTQSRLWHICRRLKSSYDIVVMSDHIGAAEAMLETVCRVHNIPLIRWIASTAESSRQLSGLNRILKIRASRRTPVHIVASSAAEAYVAAMAPDTLIFRCHNIVDNDVFAAARTTAEDIKASLLSGLGLSPPVVLYCGQLIPRKGLATLLAAIEMLGAELPFSLLLAGDGPEREVLTRRLRGLPVHATLLGQIAYDELPKYYAIADLAVLPSFIDTWGMVVNEAMASGVPVICSDGAAASRDLLCHGQSGMIFKAGDASQLAACLKNMISDERLRASVVRAADVTLEHYTVCKAVEQFLGALDYVATED